MVHSSGLVFNVIILRMRGSPASQQSPRFVSGYSEPSELFVIPLVAAAAITVDVYICCHSIESAVCSACTTTQW